MNIEFKGILNEEDAIAAVQKKSFNLRSVIDQTEAICLAAVEETGNALEYVLDFDLFNKIKNSKKKAAR